MNTIIRVWSIAALIALFAVGNISAQTETSTTKQATTSTKSTVKKKSKKKAKKTTGKSKTSSKKTSTTSPKATSAPSVTPTASQTTPIANKPVVKPAVATVDASTRIAGGLTIYGTSTLHSWTMSSSSVQGSAYITTLDGELDKITAATFIVTIRSLKGESSSLNDNAYEALKESKYKDIRFVLSSSRVRRESAGHYAIVVSGNLTIAGVTKPITSTITAVKNGNSFTCSGSETVQMSNYNVDRPSFMLGAMKAGDDVTIKYNVALQP
jgi:polyisoprenoid-binding protein YceI